jgi:acetoacetyl-CoA synthetase
MTSFMALVRDRHGVVVDDFSSLHRWSVQNLGDFWSDAWDFFGVIGHKGERFFEPGADLIDARFFADAELNVAENLMRRTDDTTAIVFRGESGIAREMTWAELHRQVSTMQQAMQVHGVTSGDRVAAWLPNVPDTYVVMLAAASLGAVFSSCSPDFGVGGVLDRFGQIEPVLLFATDAYAYGGKRHDCLDRLVEIRAGLPTVTTTVLVPYLTDEVPETALGPGVTSVAEFTSGFGAEPITFERFPFDHPWYVLFSSGTTGAPKCIVHRAGGVLLKHLTEYRLHSDVRPGERVFYFTTAGWMMWNWLASALASEATVVLYDGSPFEPDANRLFDLVDDTGICLFGISAKFIDGVAKAGLEPRRTHDLSSMRLMSSTGSTLLPESFEFIQRSIKTDLHVASMSGGTDLCGCLVTGDPTSPVYVGEIQRPTLGLAIDVVDDTGASCAPGVAGELVCRTPFPSMPLRFWGDPDRSRYRAAYFDEFAGMWHQGDFAEWTEHGGIVMHGRSDATLNPGGVRIGTAEIYRQVEQLHEVLEAVVIGQQHDGDTRVVLFVVLREPGTLDDDLSERIRTQVRRGASPRHVPAVIAEVPELPKTRSGKVVELAVRDTVHGRAIKNAHALANADALDAFRDHPALSS